MNYSLRLKLLKTSGWVSVMWCVAGCSGSPIFDAAYLRATSNTAYQGVESAEQVEKSSPAAALPMYQQILASRNIKEGFTEYQKTFTEELQAFQESKGYGSFSRDAGLGIPEVFARQVLAIVRAHQGVARIYLAQKDFARAESEATEAMTIMKKCEFCPHAQAYSLRESNRILQEVYQAQGATGKALIRKLNADLLEDHLASVGGIDDFYAEKRVLYGETSEKQFAGVQNLFSSVMEYQAQQQTATIMAVTGGLVAFNAALQPNSALAQSQMQMMNLATAMAARAETKSLSVKGTPWAIPTFTQQLVDPKQGANTPTIMKGFATNAAQAGGASYQAGAQQVTQAVDALTPYRQSGKTDGAATQVEKFAEVFNAFLTQVQEIKK